MNEQQINALVEVLQKEKETYRAALQNLELIEKYVQDQKETLRNISRNIKAIEDIIGVKREKKGDTRKGPSFRFDYKAVPLLQADLVRTVISDAAAKMTFQQLKETFPGVDIVAESSRNQRRLFATIPEWESFSGDYQDRYFPEPFTSKDGVKFKLWSDFGRYIPLPDGRKKEGFTYKFIRFANMAGFQITPMQEEPHKFID